MNPAQKVIDDVFDKFDSKAYHSYTFPEPILALLATDCDDHRNRYAYMRYPFASLVELGNKRWVLAKGTAYGDYPALYFKNDIVALSLDCEQDTAILENPPESIAYAIQESVRQKNTLVYANWLNELCFLGKSPNCSLFDNHFGPRLLPYLKASFEEKLLQRDLEYGDFAKLKEPFSRHTGSSLYDCIKEALSSK